MKRFLVVLAMFALTMMMAVPALAGTIELISVNSDGQQADGFNWEPFVSGDGTVVVFHSEAENLDPPVSAETYGLYLRDMKAGTTEFILYDIDGSPMRSGDAITSLNSDGSILAYTASSRVLGMTSVMFALDRTAGTLEVASLDKDGNALYARKQVGISEDGRYAAFDSRVRDLAANRTAYKVFVRDRVEGVTHMAMSDARYYDMSADGTKLLVYGLAGVLLPGYPDAAAGVYVVLDWETGTSVLVNTDGNGNLVPVVSRPKYFPTLSADGQTVAFSGVLGGNAGVVVRDIAAGTTELANVDGAGTPMDTGNYYSMSGDGSSVAFVAWDSSNVAQVYLRDRIKGTTELISASAEGIPGNGDCYYMHINADGNVVVFESEADNLVPNDTNYTNDIFMVTLNTLPQSPAEAIEYVEGLLDSGVIDQATVNALVPKLTAAANAANGNAADGSLGAFINQINAKVRKGDIDAEIGAILIEAAQAMIDSN